METTRSPHGFTLVELMVVIIIVGILASFAIPRFTNATHKAKAAEFQTVLKAIYSAEITAYEESGMYGPMEELDVDKNSISESKWFEYSVDVTEGGTGFVAVASVRAPGIGAAKAGAKATIDQDGKKGGDEELLRYAKAWR